MHSVLIIDLLQTIEASSVNYMPLLMGFGTSLSGGMDLDDNGYPGTSSIDWL